jgi:predicted O-linked N-acetylglucosamine transferase (SPINDLY family)
MNLQAMVAPIIVDSPLKDVAFYEKAIEQQPEERTHYWNLGLAYLLQANEADAQATWFFALSQGDEQQQDWLFELADTLDSQAETQLELQQPENSWIIRRHLRELVPTNFENVLKLVELSFQLDTFDAKDFHDWELPKLIETHPVDPQILLQLLTVLIKDPSQVYIPAIDLIKASVPYVQKYENWLNIYQEIVGKIGFEFHRFDYAIEISDLCLAVQPNDINLLAALIRFHLNNKTYTKALTTAQKMYEIVINPGHRAVASVLILKALIMAGQWPDVPDAVTSYKNNLVELFDCEELTSQRTFFSLIAQILAIYNSNLAYIQNNLAENRYYQNQLGKIFLDGFNRNEFLKLLPVSPEKVNSLLQPKGKLKIGYVGSTFRSHSVGWLCRWLFQHHNRERFEIYLYSHGAVSEIPFFKTWFQPYIDHFTETLSDSKFLAQKIHGDGIDILIDLDSYTLDGTYTIMASKPAPVQVTWLGSDASGLATIDYYIVDPYVMPDDAQAHYQEKLWPLPQTYLAVDGFEIGYPTLRREHLGIPSDAIVYFSSQGAIKRHPEIVKAQLEIIKQVPNSYFWIKGQGDPDILKTYFQKLCDEVGLRFDRLRFLEYAGTEYEHRANLQVVDVVLDTYPYSGATTTLEALWVGLPLVTQVGETFSSRNSYTFLMNAGVSEGIAWSSQEYIDWGVRFGTDEALRREVTWKLHRSRHTAPLWNAKQFTLEMENAYEKMWQNYCAEQEPN